MVETAESTEATEATETTEQTTEESWLDEHDYLGDEDRETHSKYETLEEALKGGANAIRQVVSSGNRTDLPT